MCQSLQLPGLAGPEKEIIKERLWDIMINYLGSYSLFISDKFTFKKSVKSITNT